MTNGRSAQAGFSLTELMIAMLVTLLISGAVFGLLSAGQGAFRREPELTDRQQNIRLAMDLIQRDVSTAGVGLGAFAQAFTPGLDGATLINGPSGNPADILEILGSDGECPDVPVAPSVAPFTTINTFVAVPWCYPSDGLMVATFAGAPPLWAMAHGIPSPPATTKVVDFSGPQPAGSQIAAFTTTPTSLGRAQIVRYAIVIDPVDGVPSLFRSALGGLDAVTAAPVPPGPGAAAQAAGWQLVARGIEDLQVTYDPAGPVGPVPNAPLANPPAGWDRIVQEVQVTLWARAMGQNLQGQRDDGGMPPAVRGSLVSTTSPRPALLWLRGAPAGFTWQ